MIERDVDETVGGSGLLDTPDEVILPEEFSRISPGEPRERRHKARLREGH